LKMKNNAAFSSTSEFQLMEEVNDEDEDEDGEPEDIGQVFSAE